MHIRICHIHISHNVFTSLSLLPKFQPTLCHYHIPMAKVNWLFKMTINTMNTYYILLPKWFIVKYISIFINAGLLETNANAILNYPNANVQRTYINEHYLQSLDGNLHGQQGISVTENNSSIVRDPTKGKSPVIVEDLFLTNQKNNSELHNFVIFCYFYIYYYYKKA